MGEFLKYGIIIVFLTTSLWTKALSSGSNGMLIFAHTAMADTISGTITVSSTTVCQKAAKPVITLTGKNATPPYTFTVKLPDNRDTTLTTTNGNDKITFNVPTHTSGTLIYALTNVEAGKAAMKIQESVSVTVNPLPDTDFSFTNDNTCSGTPVKFTPKATGNYNYDWNFDDKTTSNNASPTHFFVAIGQGTQNFKVKLIITDKTTYCKDSLVKNVVVKKAPDASLDLLGTNGASPYDPVQRMFINCGATKTSPEYEFIAVNASTTSSTNSSYTIDWGDGSPIATLPKDFTVIKHTYKSLGYFDIKFTTKDDKVECKSITTTYKFFNGNSPAGNLGSLGNVDDCVPYTLTWPVQFTENNPAGTTYEFTVNDGSPPQLYDQSNIPDSISHTFTKSSCGLFNNKFTVTFIAKNPCSPAQTTLQVLATEKPKAAFTTSPNLCLNNTVTFTNTSTGNYVFAGSCRTDFVQSWSITPATGWTGNLTNTGTININFTQTGEYQVKLKIKRLNTPDSRCTADSITQKITINTLPTASIAGGGTVCKDATSPEITFTGAIGKPPYTFTYRINNGSYQTIKTAANSNTVKLNAPTTTAGTFTYSLISVQENSSSACSQPQSGSAVVVVNPSGQVNNLGNMNTCNAEIATLNFTTTNKGGSTTYSWTNDNTAIGLQASGTGNISFTAVNNGTSVLTSKIKVIPSYTENGITCEGKPEEFTFTVNPTPDVEQPPEQIVCNGYKTELIKFTGNIAGTVFYWSINNNSIGLSANGTGDIQPFTALNKGTTPVVATISVTPTINNCTGPPKTFTITVNPSPIISQQPQSSTICLGETPTLLSVVYSNGTATPTYQWYSNNSNTTNGGSPIPNATDASYNPPFNEVKTTFYYCIITFPTVGCNMLISNIAQVKINPVPEISSFSDEVNSGETFTIIPTDINGNIIPSGTTYTWVEPLIEPVGSVAGASAQKNPQTSISQKLTILTSGISTVTYTVTPTSGNCVGKPFNITLMVNLPLKYNETVTPISCFGANNGSIVTNIVGGLPFTTGPPYSIKWTGPNGFTSDSPSIDKLAAGNYTIIITDQLSDKSPKTFTITEPNEIILTTLNKKDISYFGAANGEIDISASGGTGTLKFYWTKDNVSFSNTEDIKNLTAGFYKVAVTDENNCGPKTLTFNINEPAALVIDLIGQTDIKCFGESTGAIKVNVQGGTLIEISSGNFDYKYSWSGPNGFKSNSKDIENVSAGIYQLTVTDNSGISKIFSTEITQSPQIEISADKTPITCYGANNASLKWNVSGGVSPYSIEWSNFATGFFQQNLSAGDYKVTVKDTNGCQKTVTEKIAEAPLFRISPVILQVSCFGANDGSITLNFEGGQNPISFSWTDNAQTGTIRNNIGAGAYTVNISDASGCIISKSFNIIEPLPLSMQASITSAFNCSENNGGAIDLTVLGGTPPYTYQWSNGERTEDLSSIPAGNYSITVTDANGCQQTEKYVISRPPVIQISIAPKIHYDCNTKSIKGVYQALVSGGVPPYQLEWSFGKISGVDNEIMETDKSGTVVLKVTDDLGCVALHTFKTEIPIIGIEHQLINCNRHLYQFNAVVTDEKEKFTFLWNFDDGTTSNLKNPQHNYKEAGNYKVKLTITNSSTSCVDYFELPLIVYQIPFVVIDKEPKFCEGDSILIRANGADYYRWNNGDTLDYTVIKQAGNYWVVGFTYMGCSDTAAFNASYFQNRNYNIQSDKNEVSKNNNTIHLWTESIPFSEYNWSFGDGYSGQNFDVIHSYTIEKDGNYNINLKVINPDGCLEQDSISVIINVESIPNTFTPNGDGINDIYMRGWYQKIYNRNGVLLYEGTDGWDGTYNGKPVLNDTYFAIVFDSTETGSKYKTNYVTVIR